MSYLMKLFYLFLLILIFLLPATVFAQEFKSDYKVEYFLSNNGKNLDTKVRFTIKIINLKSDVYVNKFSLAFPKTFSITNLNAKDDNGEIVPTLEADQQKSKIGLEFSNPKTGKGTENTFYLTFDQHNLFRVNGNVWEVILPTIGSEENEKYQIIVHLPQNNSKKISISKPKPDLITDNTIYWNNPQAKTIYAVFGESQLYKLKLTYNLYNPRLTPVYTDIAFPPDALYQKVFINSIQPQPDSIYIDEDGNFIGRYTLKPKEKKSVLFNAIAEITVNPRSEVQSLIKNRIKNQKKYLLTETKFWKLDDVTPFENLKNAKDIYYYVTQKLNYNYKRVTKDIKRLGAFAALRSPNQAVCTEFSDVFIAISREKGILTREIQGYGFSQDPQLRPLSLIADVLHSWPEYYDLKSNLWLPVDPTWENTSGIDYFSSFDINHIIFAIHGKRPDYPYPAGMYKLEDTRDVSVETFSEKPVETRKIVVRNIETPKNINTTKKYDAKIIIENLSSIFLYDTSINIMTENLLVKPYALSLDVLAPGEKKILNVEFSAPNKKSGTGKLSVITPYGNSYSQTIRIVPYFGVILFLSSIVLGLGIIYICVYVYRYKQRKYKKTG